MIRTLLLLLFTLHGIPLHAENKVHAEQHPSLNIGKSTLKLIYKSPFTDDEKQRLSDWLTITASSITSVYGRFPLDTATIRLHRYVPKQPWASFASGPAPRAFVNRGDKPGVTFHVDLDESNEAFIEDWTAYHELSHLLIPYPGDMDLWFSEGLASYYQNITRARSGIVSEQVAWQKLYNGLIRGKKDTRMQAMTLSELSPKMRETRSFMRIYWSGVYYFLLTDYQLRTLSKNQQSLDSVLQQFQQCCLIKNRDWTGSALAETFDRLSNTDIFTKQYKKSAQSYDVDGFDKIFNDIGLKIIDGKVMLSGDTNALHSHIMSKGLFFDRSRAF
ncbi:hypothetical protein OAV62_00370 [bacterium]|nr:hypothetical protein [bacterium]